MICLDTNYLIGMLVTGSRESKEVEKWRRAGETFAAPSVAWYGFVCGPASVGEIDLIRACLTGGMLAFREAEAAESSRLYNAAGRLRRLRVDAMIAATTVVAGGRLATANAADFAPFIPHGLSLATPR